MNCNFRRVLTRHLVASSFACAIAYLAAPVQAAIMYGDFDDYPPGVVMYTDVTESSSTDLVPPPLYGAPDISGNELDFDPTGFGANAANGTPPADITDGQLNFGFMTLPGTGMNSLFISEGGDYSLLNGGTAATSVQASMLVSVEISHVDGVALDSPLTVQGLSTFSADAASSPGPNFWNNTLFVDFGPTLLNAGYGPESLATKGEVVINNQLAAFSETDPNTIAFIAKKDFKIIPGGELDDDDVIPEPASAMLAVLGLTAVAARRRSR